MFPFPHDRFRQPAATRATRFSSEPPRDVGPRREHAPVRRAGTPDQPQGRADALPPSSFGPSGFAAPGATFVPASAPLPPLAVETSLLEARLAYAKLLSGAFGAASPHEIHDVFAERLAVVRSRASRKTKRALAPVVSLVRSDFDLSGLIDASHDESKALRGRGVPSADIARTAHQRSDDAARRILARLYGEQGRFAVCTGTEHHTIVLEGRAPRGEAPSFRIYNTGFGLEKHPPVDRWRCEMHAMSTAPGGTRGRKSFTSFVVNDVAPRRLNPAALSELLFEGIFQPDVYASPGEAAEDYEEASIHHVYDVAASLGVPEWRPQNRAIQSDQKELTCLVRKSSRFP